jgi:predicted acetyltransferase
MRTIRPISEKEMGDFITIFANAYPGIDVSSQELRRRFRSRMMKTSGDPAVNYYALFENEEMRGIMRLYDFTMNFFSSKALVGGVGGLAVDLLHKKEKVAADMLLFFLQHYREKGACLTALYPFRPDFYRRMGFGYGTKRSLYRVRPDSLPKGPGIAHAAYLTEQDLEAVKACYARFMTRKHGLIERLDFVWEELFASPVLKVVGIKRQGQLSGYLIYKFEKGRQGHFLNNDILVREFVYDEADDLLELMRFLHLQADQIDRVIFYTQDEHFHYLLHDPRNDSGNLLPQVYHESNTQGVGIMYRVIDVPRLFNVLKDHNFGNVTCRLKITLDDSFFPENEGSYVVHFQDGRASINHNGLFDVEIQLDVSDFSSLVVGAINFKHLYEYGLASLSDESYVDSIARLFAAPKPICFTEF